MLLSDVRNANLMNRIKVCLHVHVIANMEETSRCHAKNSTSRLTIDEQAVKISIAASMNLIVIISTLLNRH